MENTHEQFSSTSDDTCDVATVYKGQAESVIVISQQVDDSVVLSNLHITVACVWRAISQPSKLYIKKYPLGVFSRYRDSQPQVGEHYSYL